jgi:hypothetical protein
MRDPDEAEGRILSIGEKHVPHVTGDGRRTLRDPALANRRASRIVKVYLCRASLRAPSAYATRAERKRTSSAPGGSSAHWYGKAGRHAHLPPPLLPTSEATRRGPFETGSSSNERCPRSRQWPDLFPPALSIAATWSSNWFH